MLSKAENPPSANTMQHSVTRKGIVYERQGVRYRDSRTDFNRLLNAYRKCTRTYQANQWTAGDKQWCRGIGSAQREVMWILQRLCEKYPRPNSPFQRGFDIHNYSEERSEQVVRGKKIQAGLGSDFAIVIAGMTIGGVGVARFREIRDQLRRRSFFIPHAHDLLRLVEDGKANVVEFSADPDLHSEHADANSRRGPG